MEKMIRINFSYPNGISTHGYINVEADTLYLVSLKLRKLAEEQGSHASLHIAEASGKTDRVLSVDEMLYFAANPEKLLELEASVLGLGTIAAFEGNSRNL